MRHRSVLPDDVRAAIARHPGRLISSRTLNGLGHDSTTITRWVRMGLLERLLRGQYRDPRDVVPECQRLLAMWSYLVTARPDSPLRLTGHAALTRYDVLDKTRLPPTFVLARGRRVRLADPPFRVLQRDDLPATTPPADRLVLEHPAIAVADLLGERQIADAQLQALLYRIMHQLRWSSAELCQRWLSQPPRHVARLLSLVADGTLDQESPAERRTFLDVLRRHPPAPDCQVQLTPRIRVDYAYLFAALVLEYHGEDAHRDRVDADAVRTYLVNQLHYDVLVVTKSMVRDEAGLAAHVHQRRRHREALVLEGRLPRPHLPVQPARATPLRTLAPSPL